MYSFRFKNIENTNQYEELIKVFLQPSEYKIITDGDANFYYETDKDRNRLKRKIYADLSKLTGKSPKWGILTGIRPVKLAGELTEKNPGRLHDILIKDYLLHESKAGLIEQILFYQLKTAGKPDRDSISIYLGIPFCPSRCLYCSFTSNQVDDLEIERYLKALHKEIRYCGEKVKDAGYSIESVYFGGGTPTTISARQMDGLLTEMSNAFSLEHIKEFTVEAGRPDTITEEKLRVLKNYCVNRISINPQTMKGQTLDIIGRKHSIEDVYRAFESAAKVNIGNINTDLIAGLPEETPDDFIRSLSMILNLGADNITLHTLAVKRASRLKEIDENFNYRDELLREKMLGEARQLLGKQGFSPYYLYRQKHTSGNTENTGFCRDNNVSVYNIRIMEEAQSILAMGAGAISKVYFPKENRLERVANVSNYQIYIERIDEMLQRKDKGFFIK